ncbi:MAG: hypothetical protein P4L51_28640 [Puia sp.]|nr:hypothetical protein [Puia sp.]
MIELKVDENTADLTLVLTNGIEIQILIASASYETYQFSIADKNFIGMGSGHIAIFWQKTKSLEICDDLIVIVKIETISQFGIDAKPDRVFKTK